MAHLAPVLWPSTWQSKRSRSAAGVAVGVAAEGRTGVRDGEEFRNKEPFQAL
ncbi:hypothetical protein [Alicyclobacillus sp. ALC3]|uniref:hypothetical protein n=1 Tax=Alicyclobacillus sp. ALC3 TaxID=2796143 RepID=UPI002379D12A|nr:hypothetical protein [Alicyclobacillus sp. ALC3]WDL98596.1 hypothetical protein JC200_07990 [Alicyclobacillus sp. ALC3]